jgi:2-polyprenyl-3-methyl-5-hydroxy-6-metoxy-1,4-benzoquinol methylase
VASSRYSTDISLEHVNTSQVLGILSVPPGSLVLDIGAADGSVARRLGERGCRVIGIEIDRAAAAAAERYCERVVVADVETLDIPAAVDETRFDVILLLDVLEHLRDPLTTLKAVSRLTKPDGRLIISVPNVTHAALRLQLLAGRFDYTDTGLLDRTHLHLFDRSAVERLVADAGLTVLDRLRTTAPLTATEIHIVPDDFPPEAISFALSDEDADTYQFVYVTGPRSVPSSADGAVSLGEALQRRAMEAERLRAEAADYVRMLESRVAELESEQQRITELEAEVRERCGWVEQELRERMGELERLHDELAHAKMDTAIKDAHLAQLQAELAPLRARLDRAEQVLGYARHRIVDRVSSATKRVPVVHRGLKRAAERIGYRKR